MESLEVSTSCVEVEPTFTTAESYVLSQPSDGERSIIMASGSTSQIDVEVMRRLWARACAASSQADGRSDEQGPKPRIVTTEVSQVPLRGVEALLECGNECGALTVLDMDVSPTVCVREARLGTLDELVRCVRKAKVLKPTRHAAVDLLALLHVRASGDDAPSSPPPSSSSSSSSDAEAAAQRADAMEPVELASALRAASGAELVALTAGADGCALATEHHAVFRPSCNLARGEVVDATGAGDAFLGGLLAGLYQRLAFGEGAADGQGLVPKDEAGLSELAALANAAGGACCETMGGLPRQGALGRVLALKGGAQSTAGAEETSSPVHPRDDDPRASSPRPQESDQQHSAGLVKGRKEEEEEFESLVREDVAADLLADIFGLVSDFGDEEEEEDHDEGEAAADELSSMSCEEDDDADFFHTSARKRALRKHAAAALLTEITSSPSARSAQTRSEGDAEENSEEGESVEEEDEEFDSAAREQAASGLLADIFGSETTEGEQEEERDAISQAVVRAPSSADVSEGEEDKELSEPFEATSLRPVPEDWTGGRDTELFGGDDGESLGGADGFPSESMKEALRRTVASNLLEEITGSSAAPGGQAEGVVRGRGDKRGVVEEESPERDEPQGGESVAEWASGRMNSTAALGDAEEVEEEEGEGGREEEEIHGVLEEFRRSLAMDAATLSHLAKAFEGYGDGDQVSVAEASRLAAAAAMVEGVAGCKGRVHVTGIGKAGLVGRRLAASLASTGTPAQFTHASEWAHGELGNALAPLPSDGDDDRSGGDVVIALSHSGSTAEVVDAAALLSARGLPVFAISCCRPASEQRGEPEGGGGGASPLLELAKAGALLYDLPECASEPFGGAPTCSVVAMEGVANALVRAVAHKRRFSRALFRRNHPGGALGRTL